VTRRLALALAVIVLASAACGKYGPPVRAAATPAPKTTPAVAAAPGTAPAPDTEECADPNAPPETTP
jgi:hypothetical protein